MYYGCKYGSARAGITATGISNKYFVILIIIATVSGIVDNFKGGNVQYFYIKFMLGGAENPLMYTIYQVVTGVPLGIGAFAIYPLAKKVGIKNLTVGGYALVLIGSIMGWMFPDQMIPAMVGGFLRNVGWLPNAYIFATLLCFAYDSVEYKSHMRLEGMMGVAVITALQALIYAPFAGGFESTILRLGFVDVEGIIPSVEVTNFMTLSFYLFDAILAAVVVILLPFVDVEKKLPEINAELLRRKKEAVLARGEEWIDPEEQERLDIQRAEAEREANRIADLKAHCEKKGLDFDAENAKYLPELLFEIIAALQTIGAHKYHDLLLKIMNDDFGDVRFPLDDNQIEQMQPKIEDANRAFWKNKGAEAEFRGAVTNFLITNLDASGHVFEGIDQS